MCLIKKQQAKKLNEDLEIGMHEAQENNDLVISPKSNKGLR